MSRLNKSLFGLVAISAASKSLPMPQIPNILQNGTAAGSNKRALEAKEIIRSADVVCFDVDSTVIIDEGIDELAHFCGKGQEVSNLTREAMGGSMTFQEGILDNSKKSNLLTNYFEALRRRLDIIKPSQQQIRDFINSKPHTLSAGIKSFIEHLRREGKEIYLISGGFHCLIDPVAEELAIPMNHLFANKLLFDFNGNYAGFDTNQPTSRSGGKGEAITQIRMFNLSQLETRNNLNIVMIGDGATDLETVPPADHFIGYGGNLIRESVFERSKYFVTDFSLLH